MDEERRIFCMRKVSNVVVAILAAGVCVFITLISRDTDPISLAFNLTVLGLMAVIIIAAGVIGFRRMSQSADGLDRASAKLMSIYQNKGTMGQITSSGSRIFEVDYLDHKYQEYLGYLRKTNSPCDIGDYIGEYEINNYTHRRMIEMIPDILTSFGILGTFLGLVWGLRGFNPVSYEEMTTSVSSLINGIKVAFVTSIYGLTLSIAFSYWLRGSLTRVSESLDNFLDKYYLCAVPPTDATAMNHVLANQKEQIKAAKDMTKDVSEQMAVSFEHYVEPAIDQLTRTMADFTHVVAENQEDLLRNVALQVTEAIRSELMGEFIDMRDILKDSNKLQRDYVRFLSEAQQQQAQFQKELSNGQVGFQKGMTDLQAELQREMAQIHQQFRQGVMTGEEEMTRAMKTSAASQEKCLEAMQTQQDNLREFVDYMSRVMERMSQMNDLTVKTLNAVTEELKGVSGQKETADLSELNDRLDRLIQVMERQQSKGKRGLFR